MIKKVISGGQTGADFGGLLAADLAGIETGGYAPLNFMTEKGPTPSLKEYNLVEYKAKGYAARTWKNVESSDGTVRFAKNFQSPGEVCTMQAIKNYNKPFFDIDVKNPPPVESLVEWLKKHNIETLNVAGNKETTYPGMKDFVVDYLSKVFEINEN